MYTAAEIEAIVNKFLFTQVATPRFASGARDTLAARDAVYDLLSSAFMLKPDAFFYLAWLAKNRLVNVVNTELTAISNILEWAGGLGRPTYKIEAVTDLVRAETALLELGGVLSSSSSVRNTQVPAVARFRDSIDAFVRTELTKNVVSDGDIVETPDELRTRIREAWAAAKLNRVEVEKRLSFFTAAVESFTQIRLPARSLASIVSKMQVRIQELQTVLSGTSGLEQSRQAFLELRAMRAILTKTSEFRAPTRYSVPGAVILRVDSPGLGPTVRATSGEPYVFAAGAAFDVSQDGNPPTNVALSSEGRAAIRSSATIVFPLDLTGMEVAFYVGNTSSLSQALAGAYASGAAAAAALTAFASFIAAGVEVVWDAAASQLVFYGPSSDDGYLAVRADSPARELFANEVFAGVGYVSEPDPVSIEEVLADLRTQLPTFTIFEEGAGLLGRYTASFSGDTLTVAGDVSGLWPENRGGVSVTLRVSGPARVRGVYRVQPGAVSPTDLVVDRTVTGTHAVEFTAQDRRVALRGPGLGTNSEVTPTEDSGGLAGLHLSSDVVYATLSGVTLASGADLILAGARPGDAFVATSDGETVSGRVTGVTPTTLSLSPGLTREGLSPWAITVERPAHAAYDAARAAILALTPPDVAAIDFLVGRLIRGARLTSGAEAQLEAYVLYLTDLLAALNQFAVATEPTMAAVVKTFEEQGFDRALDLLLLLDLSSVFSLSADGVSYTTNFVRQLATVGAEVASVSRGAKNASGGQMLPMVSRVAAYDPWQDS